MKNQYFCETPPFGGVSFYGESIWERLISFADMLVRDGEMRGLIGPHELNRLWSRHILNSTAILDFIPHGAFVIDIGSGAGFPGVVIAITRPDLKLLLVDSMERRCAWLHDVVSELGLNNVTVLQERAEVLGKRLSINNTSQMVESSKESRISTTAPDFFERQGTSMVRQKSFGRKGFPDKRKKSPEEGQNLGRRVKDGTDGVEILASADVVTARAVAALKKLLPLTMPLLKSGGSLIALKGLRVNKEIDDAVLELKQHNACWADVYNVTPFGTLEETKVLEVRKK